MTKEDIELRELKDSLQDTQPVGAIVNQCKTLDQVSYGRQNWPNSIVRSLDFRSETYILSDYLPVLLESSMM